MERVNIESKPIQQQIINLVHGILAEDQELEPLIKLLS